MILVTGGNGGLANNLRLYISQNKSLFLDIDELDICSYNAVKELFNKYNIEFIFHFAAYTNVDNA
ncbi:MAG TPA: sugar nucleotide-binding protein, partial [bacterium]|nr:sugar nucleotide-binding protein [bacterium]HPQ20183.1 sugar nucleotide-binding protein [bacterium]